MKAITILFGLYGLFCTFPAAAQPIAISTVPTSLKPPADVSITLDTQSLKPTVIYTLFSNTAINCSASCNALPLTLLSFGGQRLDPAHVLLHWKTTNEINNAGFYIQRSLGNNTQFIDIDFVRTLPDSSPIKTYQYPDPNSYAGTSYYRLRQTDLDSQFVYSKIIAIGNTGQPESLTLYPNPTPGILYCRIVTTANASAQLLICDMQGRVLLSKSTLFQNGTNSQQFNVSQLATGKYFLKVYTPSGTNLVASFLKN
ncbi:MAG TPA: T9SS type A sorting domain-containing protein [Puia sp.]